MRPSPLLALLVACQTTPGGGKPGDTSGPGDSAEPQDTAAVDDTGSGDDTAEPEALIVSGVVDTSGLAAAPDDVQVSLVPVLFGLGPELLEPLATTTPDDAGAFSFTLPTEPPNGHRYEIGEFQPRDVFGATYFALAWRDLTGDGRTADDPILGIALDGLVVWADDTALDEGWPAGWSVVDTGLVGTYANSRCFSDTDLPLQWRRESPYPAFSAVPDATVTVPLIGVPRALSLTAPVAGVPASSDRLGLLNYREVFQGEVGLALPADEPVPAETWSLALATAPDPAEDFVSTEDQEYALFVPLTYADADASGSWTEGDAPDGTTLCSADGDRLMLRYTRETSTFQGYKFLDCRDGSAGWRVVQRQSSGLWADYLDDSGVAGTQVDPSVCAWGER